MDQGKKQNYFYYMFKNTMEYGAKIAIIWNQASMKTMTCYMVSGEQKVEAWRKLQ